MKENEVFSTIRFVSKIQFIMVTNFQTKLIIIQ